MKSKKIQIIVLSILIAVTLGFIWGNSLLPAERSGEISGSLMEYIRNILEMIIPGYSPAEGAGDTLIRKLAHFTEFTVLGAELTLLVYPVLEKAGVLAPFCGLLAALCDETIQLFSDGRSSQVSDVWIDFGGILLGFAVVVLILCLRRRHNKKAK